MKKLWQKLTEKLHKPKEKKIYGGTLKKHVWQKHPITNEIGLKSMI